jgi:hypothetical protein
MTSISKKIIKPKLGVLELAKQLVMCQKPVSLWATHVIRSIATKSCTKRVAKKPCRR